MLTAHALSMPTLVTPDEGAPFYQFPPTWTSEAQAEFLEAQAELDAELAFEAEAKAAQEAHDADPSTAIEAMRATVRAKREARELAERTRADDAVFASLEEKHGKGRVGRVETVDGAILMRPETEMEMDAAMIRAGAEGMSVLDQEKTLRAAILATIEHPARGKVERTLSTYPLLWGAVVKERDRLISGVREAVQKKG
jgi:hypothetical protein